MIQQNQQSEYQKVRMSECQNVRMSECQKVISATYKIHLWCSFFLQNNFDRFDRFLIFFGNCCSRQWIQKLYSSTKARVRWPLCKLLGTLGPHNLFQNSQCQPEERAGWLNNPFEIFLLGFVFHFLEHQQVLLSPLDKRPHLRWVADNLKE